MAVFSGVVVHVCECGGQLWCMCLGFGWLWLMLGPLWASVTGRRASGKQGVAGAETSWWPGIEARDGGEDSGIRGGGSKNNIPPAPHPDCLAPRHHWQQVQRLCPGFLPPCLRDKRVFVQCTPQVLLLPPFLRWLILCDDPQGSDGDAVGPPSGSCYLCSGDLSERSNCGVRQGVERGGGP